ncbi:MAG: glycosyltransferase [Rikenellaceae bacterium]
MKKVSVIIPVYNMEKWVEECIRSVQNGGYENIEIIVVDDGSQDSSGSIVNRLLDEDQRIIYLHKKNGGLPAARESGIHLATGDYILFVDSDDYIKEGSIAEMVECALEKDADMVYTDYLLLYNSQPSDILRMNPTGRDITDGLSYLRNRLECYLCMKLFKRELLLNIEQQKSQVCEDLYAMVQILIGCQRIAYIPKPLYYYRQTSQSIMRSSRQKTVGEWLKHALQMRVLLPKLQLPEDIKVIFFYENIHTIYRFLKEGDRKNKEYNEKVRELIRLTFKDLTIRTVNTPHRFKLAAFLFFIRLVYGK